MTRVTRGAVLLLACGVAFAGLLLGGAAYAQIFNPQPYLVYDAGPWPVAPIPVVDLEDQFNLWEDVSVTDRGFHMNPVQKQPLSPPGDLEPITDLNLHYRWYIIDTQAGSQPGTRIVQVTNQFADGDAWEISQVPEFLLAPASKIIGTGEPGPPPPGQHYDCYAAVAALPATATVHLNDQFGSHGTPSEVLTARYLCAPAEKTNGPTVYPIFEAADGRDHLACYDVAPQEAHAELISTRDQFTGSSADQAAALNDKMLCIPSSKIYEKVPSMAPWGIATLGLFMLLTVSWVAQRRVRYGKLA